jgi:hypothetical protein
MTITQTIEIPANRRVTIEIPKEIPVGTADVIIFPRTIAKITPGNNTAITQLTPEYLKSLCAPKPVNGLSPHEALERMWGCCADSGDTMDAFLERKHADKKLEFSIDESRGRGTRS